MGSIAVETRTKADLLADDLLRRLTGTSPGHCARVDYLRLDEARAVCASMRANPACAGLTVWILAHNNISDAPASADDDFITTDQAIEMRNRKAGQLCLFVPADVVDAAFSSLANSFELIDGRELQREALKHILKDAPESVSKLISGVFVKLTGSYRVSDDARLDFALAIARHSEAGTLARAGLELWRVGLVADNSPGFLARLDSNRRCAGYLSRPGKLHATISERIQSLGVDDATAPRLAVFFRGKAMNDAATWSRALADDPTRTFDQWTFPDEDRSDLVEVHVAPFLTEKGEVERYCRLMQPDGPAGVLWAPCGPKSTLVVRWKSEPKHPRNISRWLVEIVPTGDNAEDSAFDLPAREVPGTRQKATLELDIELDEELDRAVCVRVVPLDSARNPIRDTETGEILQGVSEEFYLTTTDVEPPPPPRETRRTEPTLAFGRLAYAIEQREDAIKEAQPAWAAKDLEYFSVRLNERRALNIGVSPTLRALEQRVLENARSGGRFLLQLDEVRIASLDDFEPHPPSPTDEDVWRPFWNARENFFKRLRDGKPRDLIEVAPWTSELAESALRYAQMYRKLLEDLREQGGDTDLREALSLDTLLVRVEGRENEWEEAAVVLPTHPLRAAWVASYTQLLAVWEKRVLEASPKQRRNLVDVQMLRMLSPANTPAFAFHSASAERAFAFFQNLRFYSGVALPATVSDPHRRYGDVATILGMEMEQNDASEMRPERLAEHLDDFRTLHPYAETLVTTLVNPDRGDLFADALKALLSAGPSTDDAEEPRSWPRFQIHTYVESGHQTATRALDRVRQIQVEEMRSGRTDHFQPGLAITLRDAKRLTEEEPPDAHLAVVSDFTRPVIATASAAAAPATVGSFALYGLVARFVPQMLEVNGSLIWRHWMITEPAAKPEKHPAGQRFGDTVLELRTSLLAAGGRLLGNDTNAQPVLDVTLDAHGQRLLNGLHMHSSWVITLDRFFALDYYDSPRRPSLENIARTYVLDYTPDFTEGLGHRMMVTTAWHEEISLLLARVMEDLGFREIEHSVRQLLHYLKTVSGHLALQALASDTSAAAAVGLGVVTAWLQARGRLKQAVLIPIDAHLHLFSRGSNIAPGERRCDMVLIGLKRNIVEASFIEVKWRRAGVPSEPLVRDMMLQMEGSDAIMRERFFDDERVDGALQRSYLANVLRFYFERARRYGLFDQTTEASFLEQLVRLEKDGLDYRPKYEGYIVSLDGEPRKPELQDDGIITYLTARDFEQVGLASTASLAPDETPAANTDVSETSSVAQQPTGQTIPTATMLSAGADGIGVGVEKPAVPAIVSASDLSVPLGESNGTPVEWKPGIQGSPHLFILGIPGQGKSWTVTRILTELGHQGIPALVLDFHGQFSDPNSSFARKVSPSIVDAAEGLPFSLFECAIEGGMMSWRANCYAIAEIFGYVAGLGDMQQDTVYTAIRDAYLARGFGDTMRTPPEWPTLEDVREEIERQEQSRHVTNVSARCRPLLEMDLFRPVPESPDLLSLAQRGLVIDLHNLYVEMLQTAAGAFTLRKLYKDMFRQGQTDRLRLAIVLDEAHRLARDVTLPLIMKEGRKFGIAVIVASQGLRDFHQDVLGNAGTKVVFRTNNPESRKVAAFIRARPGVDLAARIEQLPVGSAYVQTPEMPYGAIVRMYPVE